MVLGWGKKTVTKKEDEEDMTMDEILASIRKYVTEDQETSRELYGEAATQSATFNEVFASESTGTKSQDRLTDYDSPYLASKQSSESTMYQKYSTEPITTTTDITKKVDEKETIPEQVTEKAGMTSDQTISAAASALSKLANLKSAESIDMKTPSLTLDDLFINLARPMIKEWLDKNLSQMVEKLVEKEIERIRTHGK